MTAVLKTDTRRILALWFPRFDSDRIFRQRHGRSWRLKNSDAPAERQPLIISRHENNTQTVAALCERAEALGLKRGLGLADARAMHPHSEIIEEDSAARARLLEGLADWCDRYTPLVACDAPDGLFLDISGCAHLFGGEKAMLGDILARLFDQGFETRAGLASTPGAAWASARYGRAQVVEPGEEADALSPMPLPALRLPARTVTGLQAVGLRFCSAVFAAPRAPLTRRFSALLMTRIDQALGFVDEPVSPRLPVAALSVERRLEEPVARAEDIEALALSLARGLKPALETRGEGARALELALFRVDGAVTRLSLGTSRPLRDAGAIQRLFRERISALEGGIDAGFGFEVLRLSVLAAAPMQAFQSDLSSGGQVEEQEGIAELVDRVRARLGTAAVLAPMPVESHVPERAARYEPFEPQARAAAMVKAHDLPERPIRLFHRPEPVEAVAEVPEGPPVTFRWRRALHRVARAEGPERIAPEWWRPGAKDPTRDYYRVEDEAGRRYWIYRSGLYTIDSVPPRWFMHGIFA